MRIRMKLMAAAGAFALLSLTPAGAQVEQPYAVGASQTEYNVDCADQENFGTAPISLRIERNTGNVDEDELGTTTSNPSRWVAVWEGEGEINLSSQGRFFSAGS